MFDRWTNKKFHKRSPELFHDLIQGDANGTEMVQPFYYPMHRPCANAGGYFSEYLDYHLYRNHLRNKTMVIAAEELEIRPEAVLKRVAIFVQMDTTHLNRTQVRSANRINAQDNKGTDNKVPEEKYRPGLYEISDYRPMLNETKELLDKCWKEDCLKVAERYGYYYSSCLDDYLLRKKLVAFPNAVLAKLWNGSGHVSLSIQHAMQKLPLALV